MVAKLVCILAGAVALGQPLGAISVLSHEELIDVTWQADILPLLTARFPDASPAQLKRAHSFAYGGSVVQDVGYYPLGNEFYTNLAHYVRSGDFVVQLIDDARNLDEYAFALGALSHYAGDNWGHVAINVSEPILYPSLRRKFGDWITFEEDHVAHLRTEFSFDVLEVAKHRYNSQQYHDFIGFDVSEDLLERAFRDTYGISMDEVLHYDDLTLATFRFAVGKIIPEMTEVALATNRPEVAGERADIAKKEFVYHLSRTQYEKQFGNKYRRPGIFARILGFLIKLVPFGPAKVLGYRNPTPQAEDYFFRSMDKAIDEYRGLLRQVKNHQLELPNRNLDTGKMTRIGEYRLCDRTYAELLERLAKDHFRDITPAVKANILAFFAQGSRSTTTLHEREWKKVEAALESLKSFSVSSGGAPITVLSSPKP
jgi:hypothetical protein